MSIRIGQLLAALGLSITDNLVIDQSNPPQTRRIPLGTLATFLGANLSLAAMTWRDIPGDGTIIAGDVGNGIRMTQGSGTPTLTVPGGIITPGQSVLVYHKGAASRVLLATSLSAVLETRSPYLNKTAGQFAILSLIAQTDSNTIIVCGDMGLT